MLKVLQGVSKLLTTTIYAQASWHFMLHMLGKSFTKHTEIHQQCESGHLKGQKDGFFFFK